MAVLPGGPEVHDASASHEDGEELAGKFVDDLDATPFGGAEVEKGVAEREVEHVAAGLLDFGLDGGDGGICRVKGWDGMLECGTFFWCHSPFDMPCRCRDRNTRVRCPVPS